MPRTPQNAVTRLLQDVTDARNIAPGDRVAVRPHRWLLGPADGAAVLALLKRDQRKVKDPSRVTLFAAAGSSVAADAAAAGITHLLPWPGCEIAQAVREGQVVPGEVAASTLPEIHALGGMGALGLRLPAADMARGITGEPVHVTVPHTARVDLSGSRQPLVGGRDVFWAALHELGRERAVGRALELAGPGLATLTLPERLALASLAGHAGLFSAFCVADRGLIEEVNRFLSRPCRTIEPEKGAPLAAQGALDLARVSLFVLPPGEATASAVTKHAGVPLQAVVLGGQFGGSLAAMRHLADCLRRRPLAAGLRAAVIPDTPAVLAEAEREDLRERLADAGVQILAPGTAPESWLRPGERALLTTVTAPPGCWRAGYFAAAAAACAGAVQHPERLEGADLRDSKLSTRRPRHG